MLIIITIIVQAVNQAYSSANPVRQKILIFLNRTLEPKILEIRDALYSRIALSGTHLLSSL